MIYSAWVFFFRKAWVWLLWLSWVAGADPAGGLDFRKPPRVYVLTQWGGRTYRLEKTLEQAAGARAMRRLQENFQRVLTLLPAHSRAGLRSIKIYLMEGPQAPGGGMDNGLEYFRPEAPSWWANLDRAWSHCVVCYCAQNYLALSPLWAQKAVLHELAHAYHLAHFAEEQPDLQIAYEQALRAGLYRNVTDDEGLVHERAYALTNRLEYFAELSVMYFARCNYPPTDRAALRRYDPQGYAVIEKLWRVPTSR